MEKQVVQFQFGGQDVTLETGAVARQATGAVMITMGETQILATVVGSKNLKPGQSFFPLSVHYQEKTYAAGKIPGGYFKREGRPTEKETLTSRLIDQGCMLLNQMMGLDTETILHIILQLEAIQLLQ